MDLRQELNVTVQYPCVALFDSIGHDEEMYAELLDVFLEDAPPRMTAIRDAVAAGDTCALAREAHTYKGAMAVLEASDIANAAHRLELLARQGSLDGAAEIADRLANESTVLFDIVRRYRAAFARAA